MLPFFPILFQVSKLSGVLSNMGVGRGDRVLIYMPMITEAVVAMLATVRLGAIHSVVFGGKINRKKEHEMNSNLARSLI